jgi:hypothetical protein
MANFLPSDKKFRELGLIYLWLVERHSDPSLGPQNTGGVRSVVGDMFRCFENEFTDLELVTTFSSIFLSEQGNHSTHTTEKFGGTVPVYLRIGPDRLRVVAARCIELVGGLSRQEHELWRREVETTIAFLQDFEDRSILLLNKKFKTEVLRWKPEDRNFYPDRATTPIFDLELFYILVFEFFWIFENSSREGSPGETDWGMPLRDTLEPILDFTFRYSCRDRELLEITDFPIVFCEEVLGGTEVGSLRGGFVLGVYLRIGRKRMDRLAEEIFREVAIRGASPGELRAGYVSLIGKFDDLVKRWIAAFVANRKSSRSYWLKNYPAGMDDFLDLKKSLIPSAMSLTSHIDPLELDEIERQMLSSPGKRVVLYCAKLTDLEGWVMQVEVLKGWKICVELRQAGFRESGNVVGFISSQLPKETCLSLVQQITGSSALEIVAPAAEIREKSCATPTEVALWVQRFQGGILLKHFTAPGWWGDFFAEYQI